ncbi:MAG: MarR family winged helix-turn-helix transcriptional regulator [Rhodospirillales bacterium]|jgi:DNA-binding MarR family transcriptional regulator|nr:MarR family transcriptional regulator [Magnetospirillum sp.]
MPDLRPGLQHLYLRDEDLRLGIELLFYAYRDFTAEPDRMLEEIGFGRAHHRAIYFVGRYPGINVGELLAILRITKQSLSRVLGELVRKGYILQRQGTSDRRQRRLELTEQGASLERKLSENQRRRIAAAYRAAGPAAVEGFRRVMLGLIDERDRRKVAAEPAKTPPLAAKQRA